MTGLASNGCGGGGSSSGSSTPLCPDMLAVGLEEFHHIIEIFVNYAHNVPVQVRRVVAIVIISNHEVFPYFFECLYGDGVWDIIGKRGISRK